MPIAQQFSNLWWTTPCLCGASSNSPHLSYQSTAGAIWEQVYQIWAVPSLEVVRSAAVDVTLVDSTGQTVNMGSAMNYHRDRIPITLLPVPTRWNTIIPTASCGM